MCGITHACMLRMFSNQIDQGRLTDYPGLLVCIGEYSRLHRWMGGASSGHLVN